MSKTYTAAIVGCGSIGHAHVAGYELAGVELIAVADPQPIAREQYAHAYGPLQEFDTVEEMMQKAPSASRSWLTTRPGTDS